MSTDKIKISVVTIMFNGKSVIKETIESIYKQSLKVDEIIVVDDCSTDGSVEYVANLFPRVKTYSTEINSGPGAARNLGSKMASHDLVLFMDHDILLEEDAIEMLIESANSNHKYHIFVPIVVYYDKPDIVQGSGTKVHYLGISVLSEYNELNKAVLKDDIPLTAFGGGCYFEIRSRMQTFAKYDKRFFYTFEDTDYAISQLRYGNSAMLVSKATVRHRVGSTPGLSHTNNMKLYPGKKLYLLTRNHLLFISKHYPVFLILAVLPALLLFNFALLTYSLFRSTKKMAVLMGYTSFLGKLKYIRSFRKEMRQYPFDKKILSCKLSIKQSTSKGAITRKLFKALDLIFSSYGKLILKLP